MNERVAKGRSMNMLGRFGISVPNLYSCFKNNKKIVPVLTNTDSPVKKEEKGKEEEGVRLETFRNKPRQLLASYASNAKQQQLQREGSGKGRSIFKSLGDSSANKQLPPVTESLVNAVVLNDVLTFVHGLNLQPDKTRNQLMIGDMCALVAYEHDGFDALGSSNPLGNFLLRTILNKLNYANGTNKEELNFLVMSIDISTTFIEYMRTMEEGSDQFWIPLQGCLALTDIVLMGCFAFIESNEAMAADTCEGLVQGIDFLFMKLHSLGPLLECESDHVIKLLFCQTMARSNLVVQDVILQFHKSMQAFKSKLALKLISLLQSLAPNMSLCRQICGEMARDVSILFWSQCDATVNQILTLVAGAGVLQRTNSDKRSIRTAGEYVSAPQNGVVGSLAMKISSMNKIRHALILTIPTPQELFMEICRLKNANPRNATISFAYDGVDDDIEMGTGTDAYDGDNCGLIFLKLKHALSGFQFLLRLGTVDAKEMRLSMPNIDDWVSSLAESLFVVLTTFQEGKGPSMSIQAFEFLVELAPIICESFFHLYLGADLTSHYDWIFWEMTKRMSNFVEISKLNIKQFRTLQAMVKPSLNIRAGSAGNILQNAVINSANSTEENNFSTRDPVNSARSQDETTRPVFVNAILTATANSNANNNNNRKSSPANLETILAGRSSPTKIINVPLMSITASHMNNNHNNNHNNSLPTTNLESNRNKSRLPPLGLGSASNTTTNATVSLPITSLSSASLAYKNMKTESEDSMEPKDLSVVNKPKKKKYTGRHPVNMELLKPNSLVLNSNSDVTLQLAKAGEAVVEGTEFVLGQLVDGLVHLANGTKRWFPGKIVGSNKSTTSYDVAYDDGDFQAGKPAHEIRVSKKTQSASVATAASATATAETTSLDNSTFATSIDNHNTKSEAATKIAVDFQVGLLIDGLYQLSNGSKRWFPGKIIKMNEDGTIDVQYDDGEVQKGKPESDVRISKKNSAVPATSSAVTVLAATPDSIPSSTAAPMKQSNDKVEPSTTNSGSYVFTIGSKVDGLVQLASGSSRWFPGTITAINPDGSYNITYDDGDKQENKDKSEIRQTKKLPRNIVRHKEPVHQHASTTDNSNSLPPLANKHAPAVLPDLVFPSKHNHTNTLDVTPTLPAVTAVDGAEKYIVGDLVDGLVTLANGTSRWYPGKVAAVHQVQNEDVYDIAYLDGDFQAKKPKDEVRTTKRSKAARNQTNTTPTPTLPVTTGSTTSSLAISPDSHSKMAPTFSPNSMNSQAFTFQSGLNSSVNSSRKPHYSIGETVECLHPSTKLGENERWVTAKVESANLDGTFDVVFSDGDFQKFKCTKEIRPCLRSPVSSGRRSSRAGTDRSSMSSQKSAASPRSLICYNVSDQEQHVHTHTLAALCSIKSQEEDDVVTEAFDKDDGNNKIEGVLNALAGAAASSKSIDLNLAGLGDVRDSNGPSPDPVLSREFVNLKSLGVAEITDADEDDSDNDSDHGFFAIPSIFAGGLVRSESRGIVPSVTLSKAKFPSSNNIGPAAPSLSASLNYDAMSDCASEKGNARNTVNAFLNENTSNALTISSNNSNTLDGVASVVKSRKSFATLDDDISNITMKTSSATGGIQRMLSWRERKEDTSGLLNDYRRMSGRSTASNTFGANTFRANNSNPSEIEGVSGGTDPNLLDLPLSLLNQDESGEEYVIPDVLLRSYNIICIVLLKRCIIDKYFLDHACCSSRVISHASQLHFTSAAAGGVHSSKNYDASIIMSTFNTGRQPNSVRSGRPTSRPSSARSGITSDSQNGSHLPLKHINLLFNLREYLEFIPPISDNFFYLGELANAMGPCYSRILKLLHPHYFQCCLPNHISSAEKVGEGGFGSIFKITCPDLCGEVNSRRRFLNPLRKVSKRDVTPSSVDGRMPIENRSNWRHCNCKVSVHNRSQSECGACAASAAEGTLSRFGSDASLVDGVQYAVKRIPRERSVHDNQVLSAIYNEVTSLAALEGLIGVCQLLDYGVFLSEYWLVMELGGKNLSEWRRRAIDGEHDPHYKPASTQYFRSNSDDEDGFVGGATNAAPMAESVPFSKEVLSEADCCMCLTIFVDILYIVKAVHAADVGHFDIKCNNFVLKSDVSNQTLAAARMVQDSFDSFSQMQTSQQDLNRTQSSKVVPGILTDVRTLREAHDKKRPSGQIILIDFGEAMPYMSAIKSRSTVASTSAKCRGTLCIQSPEIISITSNGNMNASKSKLGASAPKFPLPSKQSDIWSLGCLLVELLTGDYLFYDRQWADLYVTLARNAFNDKTIPLQTLRHSLSALPDDVRLSIETLVKKILVQMPQDRPSIDEIIRMTNNILGNYLFAPLFRSGASTQQQPGQQQMGSADTRTMSNNGLLPLSANYCRSSDLVALRRQELSSIAASTVQLTDTVITLSDSVIFQVESPNSVPIMLSAQYALSNTVDEDSYSVEKRVPSLLDTSINCEMMKNDLEACLLSRFEAVEKVISTSNLSRVVKDVSHRLLNSWALQNNLVQVIIASSRQQKIELYKQLTQYGLRNCIHMIVVCPEEESLDDLLPTVSRVFSLACTALSNHRKVVITVTPKDDGALCFPPSLDGKPAAVGATDAVNPNGFPTFSKLAVSVAFAIADGLSIWSNAGSGRKKEPGKYLIDPNIYEQATTSHGIGSYAPDIENACCRRVVDIILEYVDREADYHLCYQEATKT